MLPSDSYSQLLADVNEVLVGFRFRRSGRIFRLAKDENVAVIDFQRSVKTTASRIVFTIHFGVWSRRVASFVSGNAIPTKVDTADCHWRERVGFMMPQREDVWWSIESPADALAVTKEVQHALRQLTPTLVALTDDHMLRDEWLADRSPGLTEIQRLSYLMILVKQIGPADLLDSIKQQLVRESGDKPVAAIVRKYIARLDAE